MGHPDIKEAAVIAMPHERWVERPLACIVVEKDAVLSFESVREFLADKFAKWWLPDAVEFIEEIPRTSTGNFKKRLCANALRIMRQISHLTSRGGKNRVHQSRMMSIEPVESPLTKAQTLIAVPQPSIAKRQSRAKTRHPRVIIAIVSKTLRVGCLPERTTEIAHLRQNRASVACAIRCLGPR